MKRKNIYILLGSLIVIIILAWIFSGTDDTTSGSIKVEVQKGQFIIDGEVAISNHADILKVLVMWLANNRPEVAQSAVDSIADMVRSGTVFRDE